LLIAATYKALNEGRDAGKCPRTLGLRAEIYAQINGMVNQDFNVVGFDLIHVVIHMAIMEVRWQKHPKIVVVFFNWSTVILRVTCHHMVTHEGVQANAEAFGRHYRK
jgi:hypothetical protein